MAGSDRGENAFSAASASIAKTFFDKRAVGRLA
jgi:hypothetical protein